MVSIDTQTYSRIEESLIWLFRSSGVKTPRVLAADAMVAIREIIEQESNK